ncbi:hypothetical protein FRB91_004827 [Serendipita sp. 411]|nr:hypothetical protein FRB91_004827 [Serendipita sp. 411]
MHIPAIPANNWQPYAPGTEQALIQQVSYSDPCKSSRSRIQGFGTVGAHGGDMSKRIAPNHNSFYPLERNSTRPSPFMDWQTEDPSTSMFIRRSPFAPLDHPSGLTTTFPVLSNIASMNFPPSTVGIDAKQPLCAWSTSGAMANGAAIYLGQTSFKDTIVGHNLDDLMRHDWSQQTHGGLTKREDGYPSSSLFDLEPFSHAAETQASAHIVRSGSRYVCGICSKSHTRPSRAMACKNGHLGYQPFVCDGTCGDSTW